MEKTVERKIDPHSAINQAICRAFVNREVGECLSMAVQFVQEHAPETEEAEETCRVAVEQVDWREIVENSDEWKDPANREVFAEPAAADEWQEIAEDLGIEPDRAVYEPLEWWSVSEYLADKLESKGEVILRDWLGFTAVWGRCTSGQAILLDGVIGEIAEEMEILDGQPHSWANKV